MSKRSSDLAVSESLGYILIFGIVMACIIMLYTLGSQIIADNQKSASFQSMSQNFNVIHSDVMAVAAGSSPVMTTKMSITDGSLVLLPSADSFSEIIVSVNDLPTVIKIGKLVYESSENNKAIALENGAIITSYGLNGSDGSVILSEPKLFYSPATSTLMIGTIDITGEHSGISSSFTSLQLKSGESPTPVTIESARDPSKPIKFCIRTDYKDAWFNFLSNIPGLSVDIDITGDPEHWTNVTMHDKKFVDDPDLDPDTNPDIKKVIIVSYDVGATIS